MKTKNYDLNESNSFEDANTYEKFQRFACTLGKIEKVL